MEQYRLHPRNLGLFNPQIGGRNPPNEAVEPRQSSEGCDVFSQYRLYNRVYLVCNHSLAAM